MEKVQIMKCRKLISYFKLDKIGCTLNNFYSQVVILHQLIAHAARAKLGYRVVPNRSVLAWKGLKI